MGNALAGTDGQMGKEKLGLDMAGRVNLGSRVATTATRSACIRNEDHVDFADDGWAITFFCFCLDTDTRSDK